MTHRREIILVVDDEPAVRRLAALMLKSADYEVHTTGSAAEGIELAERLACGLNLLITDLRMPGVDGHELIGRIRRICPHMDVMVFSGFLGDDSARGTTRSCRSRLRSSSFWPRCGPSWMSSSSGVSALADRAVQRRS